MSEVFNTELRGPFTYKRLVGKRRERVYYHIEDSGRERLKNLMDDYNATITAMQSVLSYHPQSE